MRLFVIGHIIVGDPHTQILGELDINVSLAIQLTLKTDWSALPEILWKKHAHF